MQNHRGSSVQALRGRHLIAGKWLEDGGKAFSSRSPANLEEVVGDFPAGTPELASKAVAAARDAFAPWRRMSRIHRAECFDRLAQLIQRDTDDLAKLMA